MRWWRLLRSRSLYRTGKHALRQSRTVRGSAAWRQDLSAALRQLDWWRPVAVALVLHLPFAVGLLGDQPPPWLDTVWQVSATLVGLGVALVVFLLQAAGSQSLSSQATYRAVLAHTWIVWPTALALVFVGAVGVVERYGAASGGASSWAETWALVAFVAQMTAFGAAFWRTLQVVSPAGVKSVLRATFHDAMRRAVQANLLRRAMVADLHELCQDRVSYGSFMSRGQPVMAGKAGLLADVDRRLPRALDQLKLGERVTLTLEPGLRLGADNALAKLEGVRGGWLEHMIRHATAIKRGGPPPAAVPVFGDVLDVARRALASGSQTTFRDSMQLVVDCLADLPRAYGEWRVPYELAYVREPFSLATEDEILGGLVGLSDDVFRSGRPETVALMPDAASGLVDAGLCQDASLLIDQGTSLWRHQLRVAHTVGDQELEQRLHDRIGRLGAQAMMVHQHGLEDHDAPLDRRLAAQPGLRRLFRHQIEVMKLYLDASEEERFIAAWRHWVEWARHWQPEHDVDDLELRTTLGGGRDQRQAARELESARKLLEAKRALEDERARLIFALGTWALERRQQGKLAADKWLRLVPYFIGAASDADAALRLLGWLWSQLELPPLRSWQLDAWDGRPGWQPPDSRLSAQLWGTVLLLRGIQPGGAAPALDLGPAATDIGPALLGYVEQIASEATTWEEAAGGQLTARVDAARAAIREAMRREAEQAERRLAEAPLDPSRVQDYAERQRQVYAQGDYLRQRMLVVGAVEPEENPAAYANSGPGTTLPKRPFTDLAGANVVIDPEWPAKALVQQQLHATYTALADLAQPVEGEGAEAAVQAIAELRRAGHEPDAVLLPLDVQLRAMLSSHPEWQWTHDFLREHPHRATLSGVPVYDPGPGEATALVVCELGASVRRVERRRPGDASPVRVEVETIDEERAAQLWEAGASPAGVAHDRATQAPVLVRGYVEVHVDLDVQWHAPELGEPAARRIELPRQGDPRRPRD